VQRWTSIIVALQGLAVAACGGNGVTPTRAIISPSPANMLPAPTSPVPVMKGTVSDTAFRSVAGAVIEIVNGPSAGLTTVSDARGEWGFVVALDDSTQFRATKEGYEPATKPIGPFCGTCNPNRWVNFELKTREMPANIAGSYAMTITVGRACANFPEQARTRTYAVTLPSMTDASTGSLAANASFVISPTGANFVSGWNQFWGGVSGNYIAFWFESLVEELAPGHYLIIGMSAGGLVGPEHPTTITTQGDGGITYCTVDAASGVFDDCLRGKAVVYAPCYSGPHALILTPR
jgi:hypothetical protein